MADAKRDNNYVTTLIAVSNADGVTPVTLYADPTTHRLLVSASSGTFDSLSDTNLSGVATGDILYWDGSDWVNLAVGANGEVLTVSSGIPAWTSAGAGDVTAASNFGTDNVLVKSDGTSKGVQATGIVVSDNQDITAYDATNDGNPVFAFGASATERLTITPTYDSGAQTLDYVAFQTDVASATADKGEFRFLVDGTLVATIDDGGVEIKASGSLSFGAVDILTDSGGTTTLSNIDALDATTEATIEAAIDTLANLTSVQGVTLALADAGADAIFGWDDTAGQYENLTSAEVKAVIGYPTSTTDNTVPRFNGTGGDIQTSGVTISDNDAVAITIDDTSNEVGLTVTQNDVTNSPNALVVNSDIGASATDVTQHPVLVQSNSAGTVGAFIALYQNSASPAADDQLGGIGVFGENSADEIQNYGGFSVQIVSATDASEQGRIHFYRGIADNSTETIVKMGAGVNGISVGNSSAAGVVESDGDQDLVLQTGNATTGSITITDGANGDITLAPNGSGDVVISAASILMGDAESIKDANGNEQLVFQQTASAVNEFEITNAATGNAPQLAVTGGDSNIDLQLTPKGTGVVKGERKMFMVRLYDSTTTLATATSIGGDWRISPERAITVKAVGAYVDTAAATGSNLLTIDMNEAGTTILSTKITVDVGEKTSTTAATAAVISDSAIAADAIMTFDIDQVNETTPATGLVVWIEYEYA